MHASHTEALEGHARTDLAESLVTNDKHEIECDERLGNMTARPED